MPTETENKVIGTLMEHLSTLAYRWEDESEYEDFDDYVANWKRVVEKAIPGATEIKLTKRFTAAWTAPDGTEHGLVISGNQIKHVITETPS